MTLIFLGYTLLVQPLGFFSIIVFTLGLLIGFLCNFVITTSLMMRIKRLQKRVEEKPKDTDQGSRSE